ncbi:MAG: 4Fe-4S binding protein [Desulfatibacillum sp.]|nr:4Fe-4S binding protein [Desulfatibacillum sp.]
MSDAVYKKLANVLDTLPNGFPATEEGIEIKILKKIFEPDEAELFCDLRLQFENPAQIAERTGRSLEGLDEKLTSMWRRGQLFGVDFGAVRVFKMLPWVFGIFEFQLDRMDKEFVELCHAYEPHFGKQFFETGPALMHVVPVEKNIHADHISMHYQQISNLIDKGQSFAVAECICKKEMEIMDNPCTKLTEVCMAIAPVPGVFDNYHWGRSITKDEARGLLVKTEESGLVHLSWNMQDGQFFICNCCGCCCGVLRSINDYGAPASKVVNSHFVAVIDAEECVACGVCADERCQVRAIEECEDAYHVKPEACIGCGLCISTCPSEAISLLRKPEEECEIPPRNENAWFEARGQARGVDFSAYK